MVKKKLDAGIYAKLNKGSAQGAEANTQGPSVAHAAKAAAGSLDPAMALAMQVQQSGGVLDTAAMTFDGAKKAGRPLRKHKTASLVVHPNNARPVSAEDDLDALITDFAAEGQRDPIHIVPFNGGWAIVEGQRRWLAASRLGIEELDAFEHPEMTPVEVYLYGRATHATRRDTSAIDDALSLRTLLDEANITRRELIERLKAMGEKQIEEATLSKMLKITDCDERLIAEIKKAPRKFTNRHLYALAQVQDLANADVAIESARKVIYAEDGKVSAASVERLVAFLADKKGSPTRRSSTAKVITLSGGRDFGVVRAHQGGRIEYSPPKGLTLEPDQVNEMHAVVSKAITQFFAEISTQK